MSLFSAAVFARTQRLFRSIPEKPRTWNLTRESKYNLNNAENSFIGSHIHSGALIFSPVRPGKLQPDHSLGPIN
jgi:hypothetical protein